MHSFINLFLLFLLFIKNVRGRDPLVHTNVGWIQGLEATDGDYDMFLGVPYATVNASNPFGHSTRYPRFDRIFEAYDDSKICPQIDGTAIGTTDCLNLNIFVPHSAGLGNHLPVLVWIYGGAFIRGTALKSSYGPRFLVRHDVILVTLNYRVGPYGFMCLDIPEVPGNQGLKDQQLALTWIRENIYWFGGDVDRITLFGESAGGRSVNLHLLSPHEKLYRNVIMQSGSTFDSAWLRDARPNDPERIAALLGFETSDVYEAISILATLDTKDVTEAAFSMGVNFRPCVEKVFDDVEYFLIDYPLNMNITKSNGLPILLGINNHEMLASFVSAGPEFFETANSFNERLEDYYDFEEDMLDEAEKLVREFYIRDDDISELVRWDLIDFDSDIMYIHGAHRNARKLIENGAEKVYYYVFAYNGGRNYVKSLNSINVGGAAHADELGYLFDMEVLPVVPSPEDQLIVDRMTTMWTNFAKYSDPTPEQNSLLPVKWEPMTKGSPYFYMDIDSSMNVWRRPFSQRMAFWDLFIAAYGQYQKGYRKDNDLR